MLNQKLILVAIKKCYFQIFCSLSYEDTNLTGVGLFPLKMSECVSANFCKMSENRKKPISIYTYLKRHLVFCDVRMIEMK